MDFWFVVMLLALMGFVTSKLAEQRGRNPYVWFMIGALAGILGIAALFLLDYIQPVQKEDEKETAPKELESDLPPPPQEKINPLELGVWYFVDQDKKQRGPLDFTDMFITWEDGRIPSDALVWHESFADWKHLSECRKILDLFEMKKQQNIERMEENRDEEDS